MLDWGDCTCTLAILAKPSAGRLSVALALVELRFHIDVPNMVCSWVDKNLVLEANWVEYLIIGASTSCGIRFDKTTTASAPSAPFFVAPNETISTPSAVVAPCRSSPSAAAACARRAPSICKANPASCTALHIAVSSSGE